MFLLGFIRINGFGSNILCVFIGGGRVGLSLEFVEVDFGDEMMWFFEYEDVLFDGDGRGSLYDRLMILLYELLLDYFGLYRINL